jgi:hypothetical protein
MRERAWSALCWILCFYFAIAILGRFVPRDDTDPPDGRSGLGLYVDHRTGCHYLGAGLFGGITPRVDSSGKQICDRSHP